jgi:transcriptional regulator with XRE-family HTH domain
MPAVKLKALNPDVALLKARAERAGLSTLALERLTGVHHDVIGKWWRGYTTPNMTTYVKVKDAIDNALRRKVKA